METIFAIHFMGLKNPEISELESKGGLAPGMY